MKSIHLILFICLFGMALTGCSLAVPAEQAQETSTMTNPPTPTSTPAETPRPDLAVLNIAHRGARSLAPENTMAAAQLALEIGADLWELDVAVTADGELVVLHDDTLERTSNAQQVFPDRGPWAVHTFTLDELRQLDFGSWYNTKDPFKQIAAGAVSDEMQESYIGEPIPTLREALVFTRDNDWRVNIEIKDATGTPGNDDVVEKVVELVEELDMVDSVLISSFNHDYLVRVKKANETIRTAALVEAAVADPVALANRLGAVGYNPGLRGLMPEQIPPIRDGGVEVYVWTVNDAGIMRALIRNRVSGIFTDFPQLLKEVLSEEE